MMVLTFPSSPTKLQKSRPTVRRGHTPRLADEFRVRFSKPRAIRMNALKHRIFTRRHSNRSLLEA